MAVKVRIPTPLRTITNGIEVVDLKSGTVGDLREVFTEIVEEKKADTSRVPVAV